MTKMPEFKPGDLIKVYVKVIEGDKTRLSPFQGVVIQIKGSGESKTFVVRKVSAGVGVERIFPLNSPMIAKIEVKRKGRVRRARLTYLRNKKVKKLKSQEITAKETTEGKPEEKKVEADN
ncbi:MAG: 50S ribosomal protein L19 [candidate division WOR-3 bacterium]